MLNIAVKSCKQDKDKIIWVRTVKLGTHTCYGERMKPIDFVIALVSASALDVWKKT